MTDYIQPDEWPDVLAAAQAAGIDRPMLARYVASDCDPAEQARVAAWLESSPKARAMVAELEAIWRLSATAERAPGATVDDAWAALRQRMAAAQRSVAGSPRQVIPLHTERHDRPRPLGLRPWAGGRPDGLGRPVRAAIAAMVLLAVGASVSISVMRAPSPRAGVVYTTAAAERETITLADGSRITLGPSSRLQLAADYGRRRRVVYLLDGEGYFAVTHDAAKPFVVHARNAVAEDIGTRFVVRRYPEDAAVEVVVAEGAVSVGDSTAPVGRRPTLHSGTLGEIDATGTAAIRQVVDTNPYVSWTRGDLVFDGTPLPDVARQLSRWYGADVHVRGDGLDRRHFTGAYSTESLDQVLAFVTAATGTRTERIGGTIWIAAR